MRLSRRNRRPRQNNAQAESALCRAFAATLEASMRGAQPRDYVTAGQNRISEGLYCSSARMGNPAAVRKSLIACPCLLYTSDAADERSSVDLGGRRIIK